MLDEVRGGFAVFNKPLAADTLSSGATVPALLMIMPIPPNSVADLCTACSTAISSAIESKTNIFRACSPGRPTGLAPPPHRPLFGGAVAALRQDVEFAFVRQQLDLHAGSRLLPRLGEKMLLQARQATFRRAQPFGVPTR